MPTPPFTSPFAQPSTPPSPVVVLLDATELYFAPAASILAFEDLEPGPSVDVPADHSQFKCTRFHPYRREAKSASSTSVSACSATPCLSKSGDFNRADSSPLSSCASLPRASPSPPSNEPRRPTTVTEKIKIERPTGAGRKNLQSQVQWEKTLLSDMKKSARALIRDNLDTKVCFKDQNEAKMNVVKDEMLAKFPILDNYENMWPLDILVMGLLKYSSSHTKQASTQETMKVVQEVIGPVSSISSRTRRSKAS
ncbi:hypothetical protein Hypma_014540 [Hypsizygus marmoreus]|uniref:Uncharacterized protein n=1 Tax=Hypsizygus marmoreus TaxID=39966 RepID=A0A369J9I5_HYPMA|nr:hypothetical protein Hypma_014540 [Hypsizygus marmoreus]